MGIFWKTVRLIYVIKNCRPAEEGGVNVTKEQLGALILILINERYTLLRKSSKLVSLEGMSEMTEIEADEETDYSDLYRAVNSLKEELRLAVILYYIEDNKISVCVDTVRVEDNLQLLGHNNVSKEWSTAVGADGKIANNTLSYIKSGDGVDTVDEIVKTENMEQKLVYATVTYTNKTDKEINHMLYLGTLMLMNHENGIYQICNPAELPGKDYDRVIWDGVAHTGEMTYYSLSEGYGNGENYIASLKPGESIQVNMAWIVNENDLDHMYLNLNGEGGADRFEDSTLKSGVVDICQ